MNMPMAVVSANRTDAGSDRPFEHVRAGLWLWQRWSTGLLMACVVAGG